VKVLFTGIQPTGFLHLGNYYGAVRNWVELQHRYTSYFSVVDYHAVTIQYEPRSMPEKVFDMAVGLYACGLDLEKTTVFVQSEVPGHTELTWIFNTVTPLGELERMTQFKDKSRQNRRNVNVGLLDYPVLQAADILIYKGEVVPVGEDQVQHVEFAREVARKFNARYGPVFPECQALLTDTPRIKGLDGDAKMSKSKNNYIALMESREDIWAKVRIAKTDPARIRRSDPGTPELCNLFSYHQLVTAPDQLEEIRTGCTGAGIGCIDCKKIMLDNLMQVLDPIRERYEELKGRRTEVREVLNANAAACRKVVRKTILETKERMGLTPVWEI
jgi:tryptophanyl-tRNA synthetase